MGRKQEFCFVFCPVSINSEAPLPLGIQIMISVEFKQK